jgi:hypothetical protein
MTEEDTVIMTVDVATIERAPNGALQVRLITYGRNWSECWFEETMIPSGPNEWRWKMSDPNVDCVVVLTLTKSEIAIASSDDCDSQFCGHRAYLQSTFLMSDRHPVGTYDWSGHP